MRQAKDYIIFPLDVSSSDEAKSYVELLADQVGLFKVGLELFIRSGPDIVRFINAAGAAGVFLDLKLHDIPATVFRAMAGIADLDIQFATVHCGETPKMLEAAVIRVVSHLGVAEVPLAHHGGLVPRREERLRQKMLIGVHTRVVPGEDNAVGDTQADGIAAGHQGSPCR